MWQKGTQSLKRNYCMNVPLKRELNHTHKMVIAGHTAATYVLNAQTCDYTGKSTQTETQQ